MWGAGTQRESTGLQGQEGQAVTQGKERELGRFLKELPHSILLLKAGSALRTPICSTIKTLNKDGRNKVTEGGGRGRN